LQSESTAEELGSAVHIHFDPEVGVLEGTKLCLGKCPKCSTLIVGKSVQLEFEGWEQSQFDEWSDIERVYPQPSRTFRSFRIPQRVTQSLSKGEKCLQAGATPAACVMFGRALESIAHD
jgi:hypothetical protein